MDSDATEPKGPERSLVSKEHFLPMLLIAIVLVFALVYAINGGILQDNAVGFGAGQQTAVQTAIVGDRPLENLQEVEVACKSEEDCKGRNACETGYCDPRERTCTYSPVLECGIDDGCCPRGCTTGDDPDCRLQQAIEHECSSNADCSDGSKATTDECALAGNGVQRICKNTLITKCIDDDQYCPRGCTIREDRDCTVTNRCRLHSQCYDADSCTLDKCNAKTGQCSFTMLTVCKSGDGCCPAGCTASADRDCAETLPDLSLSSPAVYRGAGGPVHARLNVLNSGHSDVTEAVYLCLYRNAICQESVPVNKDAMGSVKQLGKGASYTIELSISGAKVSDPLVLMIDRSELSAFDNSIPEINEDNNALSIDLGAATVCTESYTPEGAIRCDDTGSDDGDDTDDGNVYTDACIDSRFYESYRCTFNGCSYEEKTCLSSTPCAGGRCVAASPAAPPAPTPGTGARPEPEHEGQEQAEAGKQALSISKIAQSRTVVHPGAEQVCLDDDECPGGRCEKGVCVETVNPVRQLVRLLISLFS